MSGCSFDNDSCGTGLTGGSIPRPGDPDNFGTISARGIYGGIRVMWGYPLVNAHAVAHVKVFRGSSSRVEEATEIATTNTNYYEDKFGNEERAYYYWVQFVSMQGTEYEKIGPAWATSMDSVDEYLDSLYERINEGVLSQALQEKIGLIGLNNLGITQEILDRAANDDALGASIEEVRADAENALAVIQEEKLARITESQSFASTFDTLYVSLNNKAEIIYSPTAPANHNGKELQVGTLWVDTDDGDKHYRWSGTDWVPIDIATINQTAAAVQENNRAMIGYCRIGNKASNHETPAECRAAGGEWFAAAPFADSVKTVQVVDAQGNTSSVQQRMESYQTKLGDLGSLYTVNVDTNGLVGGFGIYNDGTEIEAGFNVDRFWVGRANEEYKPFVIENNNIAFNGLVSFTNVTGEGRPEEGATRNVYRGHWRSNYGNYDAGDIVIYNGNGWVAKNRHWASTTRRPPGTSTGFSSYWQIHTVKGDTPTVSNNGNGTYTITGDNGSITIHDGTDAPIPTVTNLGGGKYRINDGSGNTVTVEDGYTPQKGIDYFDGVSGDYYSFVYKEYSSQPSKPYGGSFNGTSENVPSGWSDTPPSNTSNIVWVSRAIYTEHRNTLGNTYWLRRANWSTPAKFYEKGADGATGQGMVKGVAFRRTTTDISSWSIWGGSFNSPTPTSSGWHDGIPNGTSPLWMTSRLFTSDGRSPQESSWAPAKKVAELGQGIKAQFWEPGRSWSDNARSTSTHMRTCTSTDGGNSWSCEGFVKIKGEDGADGRDGQNGQDGQDGQDGASSKVIYRGGTNAYRPNDSYGVPYGWSESPPSSGIVWECIGNKDSGNLYYKWGEPKVSADYWRKPNRTTIDGNKIYTGDAYVDTLQIKGHAITIADSAYTASEKTSNGDIQAIWGYSQDNATVFILGMFAWKAADSDSGNGGSVSASASVTVGIDVDGVRKRTVTVFSDSEYEFLGADNFGRVSVKGAGTGIIGCELSAAYGSRNIKMVIQLNNGSVSQRYLQVMGVKR